MTTLQGDPVILHRHAGHASLIEAAVATFGSGPAVAMLHGLRPQLGLYRDGAIWGPNEPLDLEGVYRADLFDIDGQLRWYLPQGSDTAQAVIVTEQPDAPEGFDHHQELRCLTIDRHDHLWAALDPHAIPEPLPDGWQWAGSARTAGFAVPVAHKPNTRPAIAVREYVVVDPDITDQLDGNAYVIDERYMALETIDDGASPDKTGEPQ